MTSERAMDLRVAPATELQAGVVASMTVALTEEISEALGASHFDLQAAETERICADLLAEGRYVAFIAWMAHQPVGFVGLSEGHALYAGGTIGTLQEFYVVPRLRGLEIGSALLQAVVEYAHSKSWKRLEVCTPPLPEFEASLRFYARRGFEVTGGRKMKFLVQ